MLVLCVHAGALTKAQGYVDTYNDRIVLMEEGAWHVNDHPHTLSTSDDAACRGIDVTDMTANDRDIIEWIFEHETTIVV